MPLTIKAFLRPLSKPCFHLHELKHNGEQSHGRFHKSFLNQSNLTSRVPSVSVIYCCVTSHSELGLNQQRFIFSTRICEFTGLSWWLFWPWLESLTRLYSVGIWAGWKGHKAFTHIWCLSGLSTWSPWASSQHEGLSIVRPLKWQLASQREDLKAAIPFKAWTQKS